MTAVKSELVTQRFQFSVPLYWYVSMEMTSASYAHYMDGFPYLDDNS